MDPANEYDDASKDDGSKSRSKDDNQQQHHLPYDTLLDASEDIINLSSVMNNLNLGPNGGLIYCLEYMEHHVEGLIQIIRERLKPFGESPPYLLLDLPGQVELFTHNTCVQTLLGCLVKQFDLRLCSINLIDSHACTDVTKFISAALLSTTTMLRLEMPSLNVLSKIDLIGSYGGSMPFNLDYYMGCNELDRLIPYLNGSGFGNIGHDSRKGIAEDDCDNDDLEDRLMDDEEYRKARLKTQNTPFRRRHEKLHRLLCEVIEDFSLLSYLPLNINDGESVGRVVAKIDQCNGYVFTKSKSSSDGSMPGSNFNDMFDCAIQTETGSNSYEYLTSVQERFMGLFQDEIPELRRKHEEMKTPNV